MQLVQVTWPPLVSPHDIQTTRVDEKTNQTICVNWRSVCYFCRSILMSWWSYSVDVACVRFSPSLCLFGHIWCLYVWFRVTQINLEGLLLFCGVLICRFENSFFCLYHQVLTHLCLNPCSLQKHTWRTLKVNLSSYAVNSGLHYTI